jgi:hypothetical protein
MGVGSMGRTRPSEHQHTSLNGGYGAPFPPFPHFQPNLPVRCYQVTTR